MVYGLHSLESAMRRHNQLVAILLVAAMHASHSQTVRQQDLRHDEIRTARPFGTLRQQADLQQAWLAKRLTTVLPTLMRRHGIDMWVVPMREYNEDPVFTSLVSATTFAARRRTIYVFFDPCAKRRTPNAHCDIERIALGGSSQGGLYKAVRSTKAAAGPAGGKAENQAELWGDEQWSVLKQVIEERKPNVIGIDISRTFAVTDGLSAGEYEGMSAALGPSWTKRFKRAEGLPLDLIATRLPEEAEFFKRQTEFHLVR
jgi:hypothetical protein